MSIYPELKDTKEGKTKFQSIFDFLLSEKNKTRQKKWPKLIEDAVIHNKDIKKNYKDIKILDKTMPVECYDNEFINVKNLKNQFKRSTKNYIWK